MKEVVFKCDICGEQDGKVKVNVSKRMQVIFMTEQDEGRCCEPYLEISEMDICDDCLKKITKNKTYIIAQGAMGHNKYTLN